MNQNKHNDPARVTAIIDRWIALNEEGLQVSVEELCKDSPDLLDSVVKQINALDRMDGLLLTQAGSTLANDSRSRDEVIGRRTGAASTTHAYQLQKLHASGGCSEVYIATDVSLGREVAVKFLRPDLADIPASRARLQREASITSRLDHPGVVSIHSMGEDKDGQPFYTMRFVDGQSLREAIDQLHELSDEDERSIRSRQLLGHFLDVCQTIAFAHKRNVIHRDLKPENIVIGSFGESYVIDWGLAKSIHDDSDDLIPEAMDSEDSQLTRAGSSVGTPAYMSPEQAIGNEIGKASDIFNLGATLYTILTGQPPYGGNHVMDVLKQAAERRCQPPCELDRGIDHALQAVCLKAMARQPEERYSNASDLADDLERYLADQPVSACPEPLREKVRRWVKRRRTMVTAGLVAGLVAVLLLTIGIALLLDKNQHLTNSRAQEISQRIKTAEALTEANSHLYSHRIALAHSELMKNNVVRADEILEQCPIELRRWEWHHLRWLVDRHKPLYSIEGMGAMIRAVAFSHDGQRIAFGDVNGRLMIYRVSDWQLEKEIEDRSELWCVAFSPDGKRIVTAGTVRSDGRRTGSIHLWDIESGEKVAARKAHGNVATSLQYSADGQRLLTGGSRGDLRVRDAISLEPIDLINEAHRRAVRDVVFLNKATREYLLTSSDDGGFKVWNTAKGDEPYVQGIRAHDGGIAAIDNFQDKLIATAGGDHLLRIWKVHPDEEIENDDDDPVERQPEILVGHRDKIETLAFSSDGKIIASGGMDRNVRLWDVEAGRPLSVIRRHTSHVRIVCFDPNGQYLATAGDDNVVHIWSVNEIVETRPPGQFVTYCPTRNHVASATLRRLTILDVDSNQTIAQLDDFESSIHDIDYSPTGDLISVIHKDGYASIVDAATGEIVHRLRDNESIAYSQVFIPDKDFLAIGHADGTIELWDMETFTLEGKLEGENTAFRIAYAEPTTQLVVGHTTGSIALWDISKREVVRIIPAHEGMMLDLEIHPDGQLMASTATDGNVKIWDLESGGLKHFMKVGASWVNCLQFTPDGNRLLSGSEHTVMFWDCAIGKEVLSVSLDRCIHSMSFSRDGKYLAVAGEDPQIRIWMGSEVRNGGEE